MYCIQYTLFSYILERRSCTDSEFTCSTSRHCIPKKYVCDKFGDCKDNSDEPPNCKQQRTCKNNKFECNDGECIKKEFQCDGDKDCLNGEDERNCKCYLLWIYIACLMNSIISKHYFC